MFCFQSFCIWELRTRDCGLLYARHSAGCWGQEISNSRAVQTGWIHYHLHRRSHNRLISTRLAWMVHLAIGSLIHGSDCGRKERNRLVTPLRQHIYMFTATLKNHNAWTERNDSVDRSSVGILAEWHWYHNTGAEISVPFSSNSLHKQTTKSKFDKPFVWSKQELL